MRRSPYYLKIPMLFLLVSLTLCGCAKEPPVADSSTSGTEPSQNASTQAEPVTLEQALLKERGKPYDQSDYKKFLGGEGIINEYAEFDCNLDHGYSKTINDLVVADGKLYQANFNSLLAKGKNIQEIGTLPGKDVRYWQLTYDGEMGSMYLKDGSGYKISAVPFSTAPLDNAQYPLFKKVYRYATDGKTLEDHTAEYLNAETTIMTGGQPVVVTGAGQTVAVGMIVCPSCKAQLSAGSKFCNHCGTKLITKCPNCGADITQGSAFCSECGQKL